MGVDSIGRRSARGTRDVGEPHAPQDTNGKPSANGSDGAKARAPLTPRTPSRRDSLRRRLLATADVLSLLAAYGVVELVHPLDAPSAQVWLLLALPVWIVINKLLGLYDRDANVIHKSTLDELPHLAQSIVMGAALVFLCAPLVSGLDVQRSEIVVFVGAALGLFPAGRGLVRTVFSRRATPERCLIIGSGEVAAVLAQKLTNHPEYRVHLVGFVDERSVSPADRSDLHLIDDVTGFERVCVDLDVERVVVGFTMMPYETLLGVIRAAKDLNLKVTVVPRLFEGIGDAVETDQIEGLTLFGLRGLSPTRSSLRIKRAMDVLIAGGGLLLASPLLLTIAVAVKLASRGPVLFRQKRIGRGHAPFDMLKFRTMHRDADDMKDEVAHLNEAAEPMFKISDDPRITSLGRHLRRHSLDELPQLWNVVKGEMSLVGPRPLIPEEDEHVMGRYRHRLDLTPGVTGPWQVMGRTTIPFPEMIKLDYLYVAEWTLWSDVKLLLRTAVVVLTGRGR